MKKPNIIYVYADDLGRGMLSCYGQKFFNTPNIDALADSGMKFQRAYGCAFCAPARASLISGIHDCHAGRWSFTEGGVYERLIDKMTMSDIFELINNTGFCDLDSTEFLPQVLKRGGYYTGQIGKLEWGFCTTDKDIERHGWDYHYGYYDHKLCHGFYPPYLYENGNVIPIAGNTHPDCGKNPDGETPENRALRADLTGKVQYSQDLFNQKIVEFIEAHQDEPFFLFHPSQLPHGPTAVPCLHDGVKDVEGLTQYEKEYASMVLRLDDTVGLIVDTLTRLHLLEDTMIIFSSDNGHEVYYEEEGRSCSHYSVLTGKTFDEVEESFTTEHANDTFNGNDGMKGKKRSNSEGGVKIPYIVSWNGKIKAGQVSDRLMANYDLMATVAEMAGVEAPEGKDGISAYAHLLGKECIVHDYVVYASHRGPGITTNDGYKLRYTAKNKQFELYHLAEDYREEHELSAQMPEKTKQLATILLRECDGSFNNGAPFVHMVDIVDDLLDDQFVATNEQATYR